MMNYFTKEETSCRCGCGMNISDKLLAKLNEARELAGVSFMITSGARCAAHNLKIGGKPNSAHTRGLAVDIQYQNSNRKFKIVSSLLKVGFVRIGDNQMKNFIHCDIDESLPQEVYFNY